jgi:hypothetical protein
MGGWLPVHPESKAVAATAAKAIDVPLPSVNVSNPGYLTPKPTPGKQRRVRLWPGAGLMVRKKAGLQIRAAKPAPAILSARLEIPERTLAALNPVPFQRTGMPALA